MINILKSKSVRFILFLIYGILLIVNLSTGILLYGQSISAQKEEIDINRTNNLDMLKKDVENIFYENYEFSNYIQYNYYVDEIISKKNIKNRAETIYSLMQLQGEIKEFSARLDNGASRYVYFPQTEMVVSDSFIITSEKFYNLICPDGKISFEEWRKMLTETINVPVNLSDDILLTVSTFGETDCSVIFTFDNQALKSALNGYTDGLDGEIRFINQEGETVFSMGEKIDYMPEISHIKEPRGVLHSTKAGISFMWHKSDIKGLTFASVMPTKNYYKRLIKQRVIMIFSITAMFALGLFLYYLSFKYQVKNIGMIMSELNIKNNRNNEFETIRNAVKDMSDNQKKFQTYLDLTGSITRDTIFYKMADGSLNLKNFSREQLDIFGIELEEPYFAVVGVKVNEKKTGGNVQGGEILKYFGEQLLKMLESCYSEAYDYEFNGYYYIVFNLSNEEAGDFTQICSEELKYLTKKISEEKKTSVVAAVSNSYNNDFALWECNNDVSEILEYNLISYDNVVYNKIQLENILNGISGYGYTKEDEKKIISAIMSGEVYKAKSVFESVFDKCAANTAQSFLILRCVTFDFSETMIRIWNQISEEKDEPYKERLIDRTLGAESFLSIKHIFLEEVESLCNMVKPKNEKTDITAQIDSYIIENYSDCDLSLQNIANHFNLHPVYLSNTYKKLKGEGILKVVTRVRMEKAAELLKNGLSVSEASNRVGYIYPNTFSRTFKKYFGVSPTEYK